MRAIRQKYSEEVSQTEWLGNIASWFPNPWTSEYRYMAKVELYRLATREHPWN